MSRLTSLRGRLATLGAIRWLIRWAAAAAIVVAVLLWATGMVFTLDYAFELSVVQRVIVIVLFYGIGLTAVYFLAAPLVAVRESWAQLALLIEKREGIESDVIAALQFESAGETPYGSVQLTDAVVDYVSHWSSEARILSQADSGKMLSWLAVMLLTIVGAVALAIAAPEITGAFFNRLALGGMHYPTDVAINEIRINDIVVLDRIVDGAQPQQTPIPEQSSATFSVVCSGKIGSAAAPLPGVVRLRGANRGAAIELPLQWKEQPVKTPSNQAIYQATLDSLLADAEYQVRLGDAWTEWAAVRMIALPQIDVSWKVTPPAYAVGVEQLQPESGVRRLSVLEGSRIEPVIELQSDDSSRFIGSAKMVAVSGDDETTVDLEPVDGDTLRWQLPAPGAPLNQVAAPYRLRFEITDNEGLKPEKPIEVYVRIRPDRPPTGSARVVHRAVLPSATPVIEYSVNDDFGIAEAWLDLQIERVRPSVLNDADESAPAVETAKEVLFDKKISAKNLPFSGTHELKLSPLRLIKGDRVKITLNVVDDRGKLPGKAFVAESLTLEITDESGVLAVIAESDEESEKRLTEIIQKQLGIGETP